MYEPPHSVEGFVAYVYVLICPACSFGDTNVYLVFSPFTARSIPLLATTKVSAFFFVVSMLSECDVYRLIARFAGLSDPF